MASWDEAIQSLVDHVREALAATASGQYHLNNGGVWAIRSERGPNGLTGKVLVAVNNPTARAALHARLETEGLTLSPLSTRHTWFLVSQPTR